MPEPDPKGSWPRRLTHHWDWPCDMSAFGPRSCLWVNGTCHLGLDIWNKGGLRLFKVNKTARPPEPPMEAETEAKWRGLCPQLGTDRETGCESQPTMFPQRIKRCSYPEVEGTPQSGAVEGGVCASSLGSCSRRSSEMVLRGCGQRGTKARQHQ